MLKRLLKLIKTGFRTVGDQPQFLIAFILVIILPLVFVYTGRVFLDASRSNTDTLLKNEIGLLHDVVTSFVKATDFNYEVIQSEIESIASVNANIQAFQLVKIDRGNFVPVVALNPEAIGVSIEEPRLFRDGAGHIESPQIYPAFVNGVRHWYSFKGIEIDGEVHHVLYTDTTLGSIDTLFEKRERLGYYMLGLVYALVLLIAFWILRLTNYKFLYRRASEEIEAHNLFTNMLTHELRTPLTAIEGYASMIEEDPHGTKITTYAHTIKNSAERLLAIVNDLLDVARLESGRLKMHFTECSIGDVVERVKVELDPLAEREQCALTLLVPALLPQVTVDNDRLLQALINVTSNAIKYAHGSPIEIEVVHQSKHVEIRVKDNGMGISAEDQKALFAPFFRVKGSEEAITGTGLGMYITRELIEKMGGSIAVESIKGVGTHVVIHLPVHNSK